MINVMVADKDPMARKLIELFIDNNKQYKLIKSIDNVTDVKKCCATYKVDLLLMNICMGLDVTSFEIAKDIKNQFVDIKIIMITDIPEYSFIDRAKDIGVESFWYKDADEKCLLEIMDLTIAGELIYPKKTPTIKIGTASSDDFTARELEVLRELVGGKPDAEIAKKLCISVVTVKQHIQKLREKTGFKNRTELAVRVRESGLVISDYRL